MEKEKKGNGSCVGETPNRGLLRGGATAAQYFFSLLLYSQKMDEQKKRKKIGAAEGIRETKEERVRTNTVLAHSKPLGVKERVRIAHARMNISASDHICV
ncbi:hypothetical protein POVWA1_013400 [Plasmodium ovale wallikeri]|uniref:Uncharacterized protein n=1 Tax=Plasmodium ovale wallikeri TaxID=864142 RepID=A0A1A8YMW7_PLAOA|nr:hypothetical protein POVWA1_013400 [Plasmodium ovale wallikeri]